MAAEELQSAGARERCDLRVVGLALLAVEAVARPLIDEQRRLRVRRLGTLDVGERDAAVVPPVVIHDGTLGFLVEVAHDLAVIHHRAGEGQLAGRKIGQGSAPAVADGCRTAGVFHHRKRGREVALRILRRQLLRVAAPLLHVGGGVAELYAAAHPVEQAGRDGRVAVGGEAVGHFADVAVDPEDLLDHHQCAARAAGCGREPRLKLVAVAGHDGGVLAHGLGILTRVAPRGGVMLVGSAVRRVAIVGGLRIPFARSYGAYATASNQDMLTAAFRAVVERFKLQGERLGDVAAGAVLKHSRDYNLVRESVLSSGLDPHTPGLDMQRACGTSLEATIDIGNKIALGQIEAGLAGGTDSISDAPLAYPRAYQQLLLASYRGRNAWQRLSPWLGLRPRHFKPVLPAVVEPRTGLSMGQSTEIMAKRWQIGRAEQAQLAQHSHLNAAAAWRSGFYDDLVVEYLGLKSDNNVRADSSAEKLARLRPSFAADGTLTAGNSTPLTDGASAVLLATPEWAAKRKLPVLAYLRYGKAWAVDFAGGKEGLLMAPTYAVPAMLRDAGLTLQDFDYYEIHEAFAAQVLWTLKAWQSPEYCRDVLGLPAPLGSIDLGRLNVKGGSVAIGHPFAATGARIVGTLAKILAGDARAKRGLISVCTAGGMGVTAIVER